MSKKGIGIVLGAIALAMTGFIVFSFLLPWNSPVKVLLTPKQYKHDRLRHNALVNYQMDKMRTARPLFEKLLKLEPDNEELHYRMGVVQSRLGEPDEAIKEFDKAFKLSKGTLGEAQASIAAIHIQQGMDLLRNDNPRDAGTYFDKAEKRLDSAYEALKTLSGKKAEKSGQLRKQFSLLRGQVYIGQGLSALLHMERTDVAEENFKTAENVFDAATDLKPFREYRVLSHAYADLGRVYKLSFMDETMARKAWKKSFDIMQKAIDTATPTGETGENFGNRYEVFQRKYRAELKTLKQEAAGKNKKPNAAPAGEPEKLDNAIDIFQ